jgi:hypothetical protein
MAQAARATERWDFRVGSNERAKRWHEQYGFEEAPTDPLHLMLLMKDLRRFGESR